MPSRTSIFISAGVVFIVLVAVLFLFWPKASSSSAPLQSLIAASGNASSSSGSSLSPTPRQRTSPAAGLLSEKPPLANPPALTAAMDQLVAAGLIADASEAFAMLAQADSTSDSPIENEFLRFLADPTDANFRSLQSLTDAELRERRLDTVRTDPARRQELADSTRRLALRLLASAEYARTSGLVEPFRADEYLWGAAVSLSSLDTPELSTTLDSLIRRRLTQTLDDESRWGAEPLEKRTDPNAPDAAARHWVRGLLDLAMESASRSGDAAAFESYAQRYLNIPYADIPQNQESWQRSQSDRVQTWRNLLRTTQNAPR